MANFRPSDVCHWEKNMDTKVDTGQAGNKKMAIPAKDALLTPLG